MAGGEPVPARVLADFHAEMPGELSVSARDDVLLVVGAPIAEGWSLVLKGDESGLVPETYVEPLPQMSRRAAPAVLSSDFESQHESELSAAAGEMVWLLDPQPENAFDGWTAVVQDSSVENPRPGLVPTAYLEVATVVVARAAFAAEEVNEMSVGEGQRLYRFLDAEEEGWCEVIGTTGKRGLVPATYVEPEDDAGGEGQGDDGAGGEGGGGGGSSESVSEWLADVMVLLSNAEEGVTLDAEALASFEPEADVELRLQRGERVAILQNVSPPDGWAVALRRSAAPGGRPDKGLVPATYVQLLPFEATCTVEQLGVSAPKMAHRVGERLMVDPARSTPEAWWAARHEGGDAQKGKVEASGLVPRAHVRPFTQEDLQEELRREAELVRQESVLRRELQRKEHEGRRKEEARRADEERERKEEEERKRQEQAEAEAVAKADQFRRDEMAKRQAAEAAARKQEEERSRKEAQEKREATAKAERDAAERATQDKAAAARAAAEAEERARREAEERARKLTEERARKLAEERARKDAEERARKEAEAKAKAEAEAKQRGENEARRQREAEEVAKWEAGERERHRAADEKARRQEEELARYEREVAEGRKRETAAAGAVGGFDADGVGTGDDFDDYVAEEYEQDDEPADAGAGGAGGGTVAVPTRLLSRPASGVAAAAAAAPFLTTGQSKGAPRVNPAAMALAASEAREQHDAAELAALKARLEAEERAAAEERARANAPAAELERQRAAAAAAARAASEERLAAAAEAARPATAPTSGGRPRARGAAPRGEDAEVLAMFERQAVQAHNEARQRRALQEELDRIHGIGNDFIGDGAHGGGGRPDALSRDPSRADGCYSDATAAAAALSSRPPCASAWHELSQEERKMLMANGWNSLLWDADWLATQMADELDPASPGLVRLPSHGVARSDWAALAFAPAAAAISAASMSTVAGATPEPAALERPFARRKLGAASANDDNRGAGSAGPQRAASACPRSDTGSRRPAKQAGGGGIPAAAAAPAAAVPAKAAAAAAKAAGGGVAAARELPQLRGTQSAGQLERRPPRAASAAPARSVVATVQRRMKQPANGATSDAKLCNEQSAALIHAFAHGAFAGERTTGERPQIVRRVEAEALAKSFEVARRTLGARPATSIPRAGASGR